MTIRNLDKMFYPRSVAVIGATDEPGNLGATAIGLLVVPLATLTVLGILIGRLLGAPVPVNVVVVASIWFFGGLQCLLVGIVGEYIGRIYIETQHRPLYIIREQSGVEDSRPRTS